MTDLTAVDAPGLDDLDRLAAIKRRFRAAAILSIAEMDPHREGSCRCPTCDGDGETETDIFDTIGPENHGYVGLQVFGIGKRLKATDEFVLHLVDDFNWLLERVERQAAPGPLVPSQAPVPFDGLAKEIVAALNKDGGAMVVSYAENVVAEILAAALQAPEAGELVGIVILQDSLGWKIQRPGRKYDFLWKDGQWWAWRDAEKGTWPTREAAEQFIAALTPESRGP